MAHGACKTSLDVGYYR